MRKHLCKFNGVAVMAKAAESVMRRIGEESGLVRQRFASEHLKPGVWGMGTKSARVL